jgi:DnaJ-class molecular chaperone
MSSGSSEIVESVIEASNLYDVLGVAQTELEVDSDIVRKKFKQMALQVHPDKCQDERSEIAFKKLHRAYTVLSDPFLRDIYDKYGDSIDGQGSIIEQAKSMFPGMKLEVAIEIAGLILGGHSGKGNTSMTIEEIREVLEKDRGKKNREKSVYLVIFLIIFYTIFMF